MSIVQKASKFVIAYLKENLSPKNVYHNLSHTQRVVEKVIQLGEWENCSNKEIEMLQIAAWFHDTGYINRDEDNEVIGANKAREFLKTQAWKEEEVQTVERLILATRPDSKPADTLEKIIKDADCSHVADEDYEEVAQQLKKELEYKTEEKIPKLYWAKNNLAFFKDHKFYTASAKENWQAQKDINRFKLEKDIKKLEKKEADKEKRANKLGRGVETMFRVTLKNHIELSAIADTKANILLSVNAIIISVAIANLLPKLDSPSNTFLVYPTMVLLFFSVISVVLSVLSTRPKVSNVTVTRDMIKKNQTNILFFGNFHKLSLEEFEWGIDYLINNEETLYNSLTKDLYYLGLVLERKYRLLRITYNVFMVGIVLSALAFVISYFVLVEVS